VDGGQEAITVPMNSENSQTSVDVCPLGFVAVLSPNADSAAEDMLLSLIHISEPTRPY